MEEGGDGFAEKTAKIWEWMPIQFNLPKRPINSATRAMKQRRLVMIARNKVENYERDLQELEDESGQEIF